MASRIIDPITVELTAVDGTPLATPLSALSWALGGDALRVTFDRQAVIAALGSASGPTVLTVAGTLLDGTSFAGEGTVEVVRPN